eukprot:8671003-Pyramimonas_sp.AAC.1
MSDVSPSGHVAARASSAGARVRPLLVILSSGSSRGATRVLSEKRSQRGWHSRAAVGRTD